MAMMLNALPATASPGAPLGGALIPLCGDPGHALRLPLKPRGGAPRRDCPTGCHAACQRREADEGEG